MFDASSAPNESRIQTQKLFSEPVGISEKYPAGEGTPASPLRKILLESGLGEAIIGGGVEDELLQPQFSIGLKGVSQDDIQKVEDLVTSTLKKLADEGAVEASMHNTIEFSLKENNTRSFPRGGDINGVKVLQHYLFTNDVLYTEVVLCSI
ncbi:hypothetical protein M0R45_007837 [Rubus argutus]|uniref:Uncharacterized protein n=1 Tax=Rubus argutus TaxID=59490 RepID=A0AAW1XZJ3_RUBAR